MFCINCGKQIPDEAKFCSACGASQQPAEAAPIKEAAPTPAPEVDVTKVVSDYIRSTQEKPKPKKKKLPAKVLGLLAAVLIFILTAVGRGLIKGGLEMGITGLFNFVGDSIKSANAKSYDELDALMSELDVVVTGYNRSSWSDNDETGPLLQVYMKNNSGKSIMKVKIAMATWDKDGIPVHLTLDDGEYNHSNVTYLELDFIVWLKGTIYNDKGLGLNSSSKIPERIQAIPVSWTYSDGEKVANPYAEDWLFKYENKDNTRDDLNETQFPQDMVMAESDLLAALQQQPLVTTNCKLTQWADGDLLCATITNNSAATIKKMYIAYATWDANNNPVCITDKSGQLKASNIHKISMSDLSVAPGESYGSENGAALHKDSAKVAKFSAIAYYYEDTEGNVWENPYYYAWLNQYEGK